MGDPGPALGQIAEKALEWVSDGQTIGLGTGRAAEQFVRALGERVAKGLTVRAVSTSDATEALAADLSIPLVTLAEGRKRALAAYERREFRA